MTNEELTDFNIQTSKATIPKLIYPMIYLGLNKAVPIYVNVNDITYVDGTTNSQIKAVIDLRTGRQIQITKFPVIQGTTVEMVLSDLIQVISTTFKLTNA